MNVVQGPIGFIGQGFIGKNLADDFEERGYEVVRYSMEEPYIQNKAAVAECSIVFVAVPTPTTPNGFDDHILRDVLVVPKAGATVVIKSTILPGTTARLQEDFPDLILLHAPEFLREKQAAEDTRRPLRTIVGMAAKTPEHEKAADTIVTILPNAPYLKVGHATEAELIKYGGNGFLALKLIFMNLLYDMTEALGVDYEAVAHALAADPRIGTSHMRVVDSSGHPGAIPGRGAGGHCFPKDWAALAQYYASCCPEDTVGQSFFKIVEEKNIDLLTATGKDLDLLQGIYGTDRIPG